MFCINTHKRLKKALLCLELCSKVSRAIDVPGGGGGGEGTLEISGWGCAAGTLNFATLY